MFFIAVVSAVLHLSVINSADASGAPRLKGASIQTFASVVRHAQVPQK